MNESNESVIKTVISSFSVAWLSEESSDSNTLSVVFCTPTLMLKGYSRDLKLGFHKLGDLQVFKTQIDSYLKNNVYNNINEIIWKIINHNKILTFEEQETYVFVISALKLT